jgi:glycosyltransferase involved in cell wall biosynthesis
MDKLKILYYGDSPLAQTGMGRVADNMLKHIYKATKASIEVVGINHNFPYYDREEYPYKIFPANFNGGDPLGRDMIREFILQGRFDVLIMDNDPEILYSLLPAIKQSQIENKFKTVAYFPIDTEAPFVGDMVKELIKAIDYPCVFTEFAKSACIENYGKIAEKLTVIYHGVDTDIYKPCNLIDRKKFRLDVFDVDDDTFLITNVGRNQWRKDFYRTIIGFLLFYREHNDSVLYLHAKRKDIGGDLLAQFMSCCSQVGLDSTEMIKNGRVKFTGDNFNTFTGISQENLAMVYACSDVVVSTNVGEGFGLPTVEAMACNTPVVLPDNTATTELVGVKEERGYLIDSGTNVNLWDIDYGFSEVPRPKVDIYSFVERLNTVYNNREEAKGKAKKALDWVQNYTWKDLSKKFVNIIKEIQE